MITHVISVCYRCVVLFVWVCVAASGSAAAQNSAETTSTRQLAERLVNEITANPFGTTRADWRRSVQSATWIEFQGPTGYPVDKPTDYRWPTGQWCSIADDQDGSIRRQAVFYAGLTLEPLDCRLEQVTHIIESADVRVESSEMYGELVAAFSRKLGFGSPPDPQSEIVRAETERQGYGSPRRAFMNWGGGTYSVSVFMVGSNVGLVARRYARASAPTISRPLPVSADLLFREALLDQLRRQYPQIAELLVVDQGEFLDESRVVPAVRTLLGAVDRTTNPNDRAWLALAAEEVLVRLRPREQEPPPERRPGLAELAPFGLAFRYEPHGDTWEYARGLSEAVVNRYPETDWGQLAFVRRISGDFEVVECRDIYAETVKEGIAWLERYPTSRYRLQIIEAVAEAYETWWSLAKAPEYDEFGIHSRGEATPGAPRARLEAIAWYERLLKELPAGVPTQGIIQTLIHLRLDVDTGQRAFHCAIP